MLTTLLTTVVGANKLNVSNMPVSDICAGLPAASLQYCNGCSLNVLAVYTYLPFLYLPIISL